MFVYLKEQLLDPRTLIWLSVGCFVVGYTLWVSLDPTHVVSHERVDSCLYPVHWLEFAQVLKLYWNSSQNFQIVDPYIPGPYVLITGATDADCVHLIRLHMGTIGHTPFAECYIGRL